MDEFIVNMAIASISLVIGGAVFMAILGWILEEFMWMADMDRWEWLGIAIFFGLAAMIASTM